MHLIYSQLSSCAGPGYPLVAGRYSIGSIIETMHLIKDNKYAKK
jgi:hypothetical protein